MSHPTIVNSDDAILVVVDIQEKLLPAIFNKGEVVEKTIQLIRGATELNIPIVLSEQYPKGLGETVSEIKEALCEADEKGILSKIEKTTFSCTECDSFLDVLEDKGRDQIILCGIETHICVTQTALGLLEQGQMVFAAADAVGSRREENINLAVERMRQAGVIALPVESVLYEALIDSRNKSFKSICSIIK
ncbi:MAG: hydrolase [Planctomycetota bacterium]|jgi:nicotinamidase-related amidase